MKRTTPLFNAIAFATLKKANGLGGIEIHKDKRILYKNGDEYEIGKIPQEFSPLDYYYNLRFIEDFPNIEYWAFGSAWTQRVRVHKPNNMFGSLWGRIEFAAEGNSLAYSIEPKFDGINSFVINVPLPPLFDNNENIPLRIALAKLIFGKHPEKLNYNTWYTVTSIVRRDKVADVFTTDMASKYGFVFENMNTNLRALLCQVQGIDIKSLGAMANSNIPTIKLSVN